MDKLAIFFSVAIFLTACTVGGHRDQAKVGCEFKIPGSKSTDVYDKVINDNILDYCQEQNKIKQAKATFDHFVIGRSSTCTQNNSNKNSSDQQECPYSEERKYINEHNEHWPPNLGLSLSGGGTRAASFSVGILKALQEQQILNKIDVISSVSGGSYANYWYFSQLFYRHKIAQKMAKEQSKQPVDDSAIFKTWNDSDTNLDDPNQYKFQRTLEQSSKILAFAHKPSFFNEFAAKIQYGVETMIEGVSVPIHWVTNGLFDWEMNITPYFYFYKDGIERTYGYVPLDYTLEHYANGRRALFVKNVWAEPISLSDMKHFLEVERNSNLQTTNNKAESNPYFIINATARYGNSVYPYGVGHDGQGAERRTMEKAVFEFTPWGCYSALLGDNNQFFPHATQAKSSRAQVFCPRDFHFEPDEWDVGWKDMDFSRAVAISGAAVDGQTEFIDIAGQEEDTYTILGRKWYDIALDALNLNLGYQVENPQRSSFQLFFHKLLPWPLYIAHDYLLGDNSTSLYFSDGGHSENLGVFALVRRGVKNLIVVDSEYDPESIFESAKRFNKALNKYNLEFVFDQKKSDLVLVKDAQMQKSIIKGIIEAKPGSGNGESYRGYVLYIKLSAPELRTRDYQTLPYTVRGEHAKPGEAVQPILSLIFEMTENKCFPFSLPLSRETAGKYLICPCLPLK